MKNRILIVLVVLDLFWSMAALIYDCSAITKIPFYFWPFIVICPLFPFLLMLVWLLILRKRKVNSFLLVFAALPSLIYGIGALIFYPTIMYFNGFDWLGFGQIFWVWFYGLQGAYLLFDESSRRTNNSSHPAESGSNGKESFYPVILVSAFIIASILIQFFTKTFGYLAFDLIPVKILFIEVLIVIFIIFTLVFVLIRHDFVHSASRNRS